jgi:lysophospholipase L1-like esterase
MMGRTLARALSLLAAITISGCGDGPNGPSPLPPPQLTCPAGISQSGVLGGGQPVTYVAPSPVGGKAPVNTICAPPSGSQFSVGTSNVTCTATDADNQQASCSFTVTLNAVTLNVRRFLAFGDSITEGEDGRRFHLGFGFIDPLRTYPALLQSRLVADFPDQQPAVTNKGKSGEFAADGVARLMTELQAQRPETLLLLEGYNDLLTSGLSAVDTVVNALRTDVRNARSSGVQYIFVSTLTPPRQPTGPFPRNIDPRAIQETNAKLTAMATAENAVVVKAYDAFVGRESELVADDGLHLTPAGYQTLADVFYASIRTAGLTTGLAAR